MRFEEAYDGYQRHRLSISEAATLLGVCDRTDQRYMYRYEEDGMDGLLDQRLNIPSHLRAPVDEVMALQNLYSSRYQGWNVRHFHGWYQREHTGSRRYSWVIYRDVRVNNCSCVICTSAIHGGRMPVLHRYRDVTY